ncbi:hypothetical protein [Sphingobacterium sp.]|uniref:hypothetical protein n=1 Tax=Sphingobacterium sp. TaxID=341027 RepID=UPI002587EA97|nr:hypothetical protein [Sphingobacterium sp.]WET67881.1 MAG: hypothetical protein P0Y57_18745 [Sphingobacterium sp.]
MRRKSLIGISLFLFLATSIIYYSCSKETKETTSSTLSGEQMFRAVYFLQGELATKIDAIKPGIEQQKGIIKTKEQLAEVNEFIDEIILNIKKIDPQYFAVFKEQLESKNFYAVDLALKNGNKMIEAAGYKSKYANYFKLARDVKQKNVNLEEASDLNLETPDGLNKFKLHLNQKYGINLDDENYKVSCSVAAGICVAYVVAAAVSSVVAAVTLIGAANLIGYANVAVKTETYFWSYNSEESVIAIQEKTVADLIKVL